MILRTGSVLVPNGNQHHGTRRFVVDRFEVQEGYTRILDKDGWWIGDYEVEKNYKLEDTEAGG